MAASTRDVQTLSLPTILCLLSAALSLSSSQTTKNIVFNLAEEQKADTVVGNVAQASSMKSEVTQEQYQNLKYQILSSDGLRIASLFTINTRTGDLFTNAMIDREQVCDPTAVKCQLEFDVTVKLDVAVIKILHVIVGILDINDNAPSFPRKVLPLSISEAAPKGNEISISGAIDKDAGLDTVISYWMNNSDVFGLREEKLVDVSLLKIILLKDLDRETQAQYDLTIYAKDGNTSAALTGSLSVLIIVTDVNDHSPQFSKPLYNFTVKEDAAVGSLVGRLEAADLDAGDNARISFRFSSLTSSKVLQLFSLDADTGNVSVNSGLEYESGQNYQIVIEAKDHGESPRASQVILVINVLDVGNTPPKLSLTLADPLYQESTLLSESLPVAWFVGTLSYQDNDDGENGQVDCMSLNSHFILQSMEQSGYAIMIHKRLDRENQNEMTVVLKCSDRGSPSLSAFINFTVVVSDENDNSPVFEVADYTGSVTELVQSQKNIVQVSAVDPDEGVNREVTYQLTVNSSNSFSVDPFTGWISLISSVDREAEPIIRLTVLAVDKGEPSLTGSTTVTITVDDVNDNTPEIIRRDYQVKENEDVGAFVAQIVAADSDEGVNGQLTFTLISDPSDSFTVAEDGIIKTARVFDRETLDHYVIVVVIQDKGIPCLSGTTTLTITIADANDHSPQIAYPTAGNNTLTVSADLSPGSVVARVNASDADMDKNAKLIYLIAEGNPHKIFSMDNSTGTIFVAKPLATSRDSAYRLVISVQDNGNPRLHNSTYLFLQLDFTNATLNDHDMSTEQKYIIISGVIAGITVVIAVIVIAIILKLRLSEPWRGSNPSHKVKETNSTSHGTKEASAVNVHSFKVDIADKEAGFTGYNSKSPDPNTSFDSNLTNGTLPATYRMTLTKELLDRQGHPAMHSQGRQRLASEDIHSDTSGDTTTSDSGRGVSDGEDTSSGASPPLSYHAGGTPSKSSGLQGHTREAINSKQGYYTNITSPVFSRESSSVGDLSRTNLAYTSQKDFDKSRRAPSKVRFSFDDQSVVSPRPDRPPQYSNPCSPNSHKNHQNQTQRTYPDVARVGRIDSNILPQAGSQRLPVSRYPSPPQDLPVSLSKDALAKHNRFQKQQKLTSNSYPLLHPHYNSHQNGRALLSLNQSIDEDDDDGGSTTTSGSYAIDGTEEALNISVEC